MFFFHPCLTSYSHNTPLSCTPVPLGLPSLPTWSSTLSWPLYCPVTLFYSLKTLACLPSLSFSPLQVLFSSLMIIPSSSYSVNKIFPVATIFPNFVPGAKVIIMNKTRCGPCLHGTYSQVGEKNQVR